MPIYGDAQNKISSSGYDIYLDVKPIYLDASECKIIAGMDNATTTKTLPLRHYHSDATTHLFLNG